MDLKLFGGFQLLGDTGQPVPLPARKAKALLAWLAMHPDQNHPRDRLALLLWEESGESQARHSLRQALSGLRKALGGEASALVSDQENVCLQSKAIEVDALQFDRLLKQDSNNTLEQAVELSRGEFLEGFNPRSETYEEWLLVQRSHYRERALSAMSRLLDDYLDNAQLEQGVRLAIRLLGFDPLQERVHRTLMQLYSSMNRPTDALRQYRHCRRVLFRELNVTPEPETERLFQEINRQRSGVDKTGNIHETSSVPDAPEGPTTTIPQPAASEPSQLRTVNVAHVDLAQYAQLLLAQDPETLHHQQENLADQVQQLARNFGGELQYRHGDAMVVLFGLQQTRGTESEQAIRFALELINGTAVESAGHFGLRVGIDCGPAIVDGNRTVSGRALNEAEALARHATPGTVFVGDNCYQGLRLAVVAAAKGESAWQVTRIASEPDTLPARTPLVGRGRELRQLGSALAACREDGAGETFLLRGEAGIGKSRLVEELTRQAREQGMVAHRSLVLDFGTESLNEPIPGLMRQLLGLVQSATAEEIEARVDTRLEIDWPQAVKRQLLHSLFRLPLETDPHTQDNDPLSEETRQTFTRRFIDQLLEAACREAPRLLIVEDIHWADANTLTLIAELAAAVSRRAALLVITSRVEGEPLDPQWRGAMHGAPLTTLDLSPLPDTQAQRLAAALAAPDSPFVQRCIRRAGGNPFYLEQLLLSGETGDGKVPDSVQQLVLVRLDLLSEPDRRAAQAASIVGQRFGSDLLRHMMGDDGYLPDALFAQRIIRPEGTSYLFSHALLRDGIYASLLPSRRRDLHRKAADWYRERDPLLTARHLDLAGDPEAPEACLNAAREAVRRFDFPQALAIASRGSELSREPALTAQLEILRGELLIQSGDIREANSAFESALQTAPDPSTRCRALIGLATGLTVLDDLDSALAHLQRAAPLAKGEADTNLQTELHYRRGDILFALGRVDECLQAHREAEQLARGNGAPLLQIRALAGLADAYYAHGHMVTAGDYFDLCVQKALELDRLPQELGNLSMRGLTRFYTESVPAALEDEFESARMAAAYGNLRAELTAHINQALIYLYTPHIEQAEQAGHTGLELAQRLGASRFLGDALAAIGEALVMRGEVGQGLDYLERAYRAAMDSVPTHTAAFVLGVLARLTPDPARRERAIAEGQQLLDQGSLSHNYLHFYQNLIELRLQQRDVTGIRHYADALEHYTADQPLAWSDFYIRRGRLLADAMESGTHSPYKAEAERLVQTATQLGLHFGLPELLAIRDS